MMPDVVDLFSGCGGMALGFDKSGFNIRSGVEIMPEAHRTVLQNLCWRYNKTEESHLCADITQLDVDLLKEKTEIGRQGCIVIGGPPCQAYSLAGRAKLKSLGEDRVNTNDARGFLYQDFIRIALGLEARAIIMENVPESTNYGGENIPQTVCDILKKEGYQVCWTILNSADYGVPQVRERVFVIAVRNDEESISLPVPTHRNPTGMQTSHEKRFINFEKASDFVIPNTASVSAPCWNTVEDAFSDLPELFPDVDTKYRLTPMNVGMKYRSEVKNDYQKLMRNWFGQETVFVTGNAFRNTPRDFPIFQRMKQGDNFLAASGIADQILAEEASVYNYVEGTDEYEKLKKRTVPPYARDKFAEKWKKLDQTKPSHTLVAHLSVDTYSHIHPVEPRGISVREAARLQSFPDDFYFDCSMGDAFKQIGNAVPPLLAYHIAESVKKSFE